MSKLDWNYHILFVVFFLPFCVLLLFFLFLIALIVYKPEAGVPLEIQCEKINGVFIEGDRQRRGMCLIDGHKII